MPPAATDCLKSRGSKGLLYSDPEDHVLVLHAQHPPRFRYALSFLFRYHRRRNRHYRGNPVDLGASELIEHGRYDGYHGLDVRPDSYDIDKSVCFDFQTGFCFRQG